MNCSSIAELTPLYLSGELDASQAAIFAAHLEQCPACAREMQQQTEMDARLRQDVLAEEIDTTALDRSILTQIAAESESEPQQIRRFAAPWLVAAASVAAVLVFGVLGYRTISHTPVARVCADAAQDHQREVVDGQRRTWLADPAAVKALSERPGVPASAVSALSTSGYRMERGKLCRLDGRVFLHLVFTDGSHRFSVFLRQRDADPLPGVAKEIVNGRPVYRADVGHEYLTAFQTDRVTAMIVTDQSREAAWEFGRFAAGVL